MNWDMDLHIPDESVYILFFASILISVSTLILVVCVVLSLRNKSDRPNSNDGPPNQKCRYVVLGYIRDTKLITKIFALIVLLCILGYFINPTNAVGAENNQTTVIAILAGIAGSAATFLFSSKGRE